MSGYATLQEVHGTQILYLSCATQFRAPLRRVVAEKHPGRRTDTLVGFVYPELLMVFEASIYTPNGGWVIVL